MATVKRTTRWVDVNTGDRDKLTLRYDTAAPYSVSIDFGTDPRRGPIVWTFARDLLADALTAPAGFGDVRCCTQGIYFYLSLTSPDGHATFRLVAEQVRAFLVDAEDRVPYGSEVIDFDAELDALLKDSAR